MDGARRQLASRPSELRARLENEPGNAELWRQLGLAMAVLGKKEEALRAARKAVELLPEDRDPVRGRQFLTALASVQAWTGEHQEALTGLAHLLRVPHEQRAGYGAHALRVDVHFAPLRNDPRFQALLNDPKNNAPLF